MTQLGPSENVSHLEGALNNLGQGNLFSQYRSHMLSAFLQTETAWDVHPTKPCEKSLLVVTLNMVDAELRSSCILVHVGV